MSFKLNVYYLCAEQPFSYKKQTFLFSLIISSLLFLFWLSVKSWMIACPWTNQQRGIFLNGGCIWHLTNKSRGDCNKNTEPLVRSLRAFINFPILCQAAFCHVKLCSVILVQFLSPVGKSKMLFLWLNFVWPQQQEIYEYWGLLAWASRTSQQFLDSSPWSWLGPAPPSLDKSDLFWLALWV